jgi:hypothetical protein
MASSHTWTIAAPSFAVACFAIGEGSVAAMSMRQRLTPNDLMGRVGSAWRGVLLGAAPIGALIAGALATAYSLTTPLILGGILQCLVAVVLARPVMRSLSSSSPMSIADVDESSSEAVTREPRRRQARAAP